MVLCAGGQVLQKRDGEVRGYKLEPKRKHDDQGCEQVTG